ncbi:hypothetical protein [Sorangium sp. So ce233]|uniref:hypothetical protein n=1 Tax=Sorangium sp. So ce233 TaxID=3133290 RepID=UPI003F62F788
MSSLSWTGCMEPEPEPEPVWRSYPFDGHLSSSDCQGELVPVERGGCIETLRNGLGDSYWIHPCDPDEEGAWELVLELQRVQGEGDTFSGTVAEAERCVDYCAGGVSTGCTHECLGGESCQMSARQVELRRTGDRIQVEVRTFALELAMPFGQRCLDEVAPGHIPDMTCARRDVFEARYVPEE